MVKFFSRASLLMLSLIVLLVVTSSMLIISHNRNLKNIYTLGQRTKDLLSCHSMKESSSGALKNIMQAQWMLEGKKIKKTLFLET